MILQPSILLSTNTDKITIPQSDDFKEKNDLASQTELSQFKTDINSQLNEIQSTLQQSLNQLISDFNTFKQSVYKDLYKVGDYIITQNNENPASKFGGTWELVKDKFLIGAGNKYSLLREGGEETHTLTEQEIPSHSHSISYLFQNSHNEGGGARTNFRDSGSTKWTNSTGGGQAHNNMPPYIAVYIWRKIA